MYRCENCDTVPAPGTPSRQVAVKWRTREYPERTRDVPIGRRGRSRRVTIDPGGTGREIVRELTLCPDCADQHAPT